MQVLILKIFKKQLRFRNRIFNLIPSSSPGSLVLVLQSKKPSLTSPLERVCTIGHSARFPIVHAHSTLHFSQAPFYTWLFLLVNCLFLCLSCELLEKRGNWCSSAWHISRKEEKWTCLPSALSTKSLLVWEINWFDMAFLTSSTEAQIFQGR